MTASLAIRGAGALRCVEWMLGALRAIRWPQVRGAMLFGLAAWAFAALIDLNSLLQFFQTLPADLLLLGYGIDYQIKAFVLLAAIAIADRAVENADHQPDPGQQMLAEQGVAKRHDIAAHDHRDRIDDRLAAWGVRIE